MDVLGGLKLFFGFLLRMVRPIVPAINAWLGLIDPFDLTI